MTTAAWPYGGGVVLLAAWTVAIVGVRLALQPFSRTSRVAADVVVGAVCFLAGFEGGWYLLPSLALFLAADASAAAP